MPPAEPVAHCVDVRRAYPTGAGSSRVLDGVDLAVRSGELLALTGPSGSGKSTLLRLLGCVDRADSGQVIVAGRDTTGMSRSGRRRLRRHRIGSLRQLPAENLIEHLTVTQHLLTAAALRRVRDRRRQVAELLDRLRLGDRASALPGQLSGGEQQRVAVAMASIGRPSLLVADEPTGNLDQAGAGLVVAMLRELAGQGMAVVVATHDEQVAASSDRTLRLRDGRVDQ